MKVNYPTDKENTQKEFFDTKSCIEKIVQFDHSEKFMKNRLIFPVHRSQITAGGRKIFSTTKNEHMQVPDDRVKISAKSDHNSLQNMSSNLIFKISGIENIFYKKFIFLTILDKTVFYPIFRVYVISYRVIRFYSLWACWKGNLIYYKKIIIKKIYPYPSSSNFIKCLTPLKMKKFFPTNSGFWMPKSFNI